MVERLGCGLSNPTVAVGFLAGAKRLSLLHFVYGDNHKKNLKKTRIKLYNTLALRTTKARGARRITAAEMKYMRRTAGYTWTYYKTNAQIAKDLKITLILDKLLEYKRSWIQHVNRMPRSRF